MGLRQPNGDGLRPHRPPPSCLPYENLCHVGRTSIEACGGRKAFAGRRPHEVASGGNHE